MTDYIDRQAAIDALIEWYGCEPSDIGAFENIIEKLPSAQPEIIRCKDCKYYRDGDCWHEWDNDWQIYYQSVINEPNLDDYCSRAERREE